MAHIILKNIGNNRVMVIKLLREATGLGLAEAKQITDQVEAGKEYAITALSQEHAHTIINDFIRVGALAIMELEGQETMDIKREEVSKVQQGKYAASDEDKEALIYNLRSALPCVVQLEKFMDKKEQLDNDYQNLSKKHENFTSYDTRRAMVEMSLYVGGGLGLVVAFIMMLLLSMIGLGDIIDQVFLLFIAAFVVPGIVIAYRILVTDMYANDKSEYSEKSQEYSTAMQQLKKESNAYYHEHAEQLSKIPAEYLDSESIQYFISVLSNGRADNLKEAMNLYESVAIFASLEEKINAVGEQQAVLAERVDAQSQQMQTQIDQMSLMQQSMRSTARAAKLGVFMGAVGIIRTRR